MSLLPIPKNQLSQKKTAIAIMAALGFLVVILLLTTFMLLPAVRISRQLQLGRRYLEELDYESAVIHFTNAIQIDDRSEEAYLGCAEAYLGLKEYQTAADYYTVVITTLNSESADAYAGRAQAYAGMGDREHAQEDIDKAVELGGDEYAQDISTVPLTAEDLRWVMEPTLDYTQVMPLRGSAFSDIKGACSDGTQTMLPYFYEMSFPGYSNLPQYYAVRKADGSWLAYYMPDHTDSGNLLLATPDDFLFSINGLRFDANGIVNYYPVDVLQDWSPQPYPWHLFVILERGAGQMALYYDTYTRTAVALGFFYGLYTSPVDQYGLHKPYPCRQISSEGTNLDITQSQVLSLDDPAAQDTIDLYFAIDQSAQNTPYAYVDTEGRLITDFVYDMAEDFSEGLAACRQNGKWGYIDASGQPVTEFVYDGIWYNSDYVAPEGEVGSYQEVDFTAFPCTSDTMVVSRDGEYGLLYRDGTTLIDFGEFEALAPAYGNELWAKQNDLWGLLDLADAKEKAGLSTELSVPVSQAPDPAVNVVEMVAGYQTGDVLIDYPVVKSEEALIPTGRATSTADSGLVVRTGPGTDYPRKASVPVDTSVTVLGGLRNTPGWVYISWYDSQAASVAYGWVNQEYLQ